MKKIALLSVLCLLTLCSGLFMAACGSSADVQLEAMPALDPVYGVNPGEGIVIDGKADDDLWSGKNYFRNRDASQDVTFYVTTHISEKGVYIYAYSEDSMVCWSNRNNYKANTHFYFVLTAKEGQQIYNEGVCRSMKIDVTAYTMPTNFYYTAKSAVNGERNSGASLGMSVEVFVSWEQLGIGEEERPEEVKLYSAYLAVPRLNTDGAYIANTFASTAPSTHHRFNKDGYISTVDDVLGVSAYGTANSGGVEVVKDGDRTVGLDVTAGGRQTAYFNLYSDSFVITSTVRSNGAVYNDSAIAKAGLLLSLPTGFYTATMFDLRTIGSNANVDGAGLITNDRLIKLTNYPGGSQVRTNVMYDGVDAADGYEELKLTIIKDRATLYYVVNDQLVCIEQLDWMSEAVRAGVYSLNADCMFKDYSFVDCSRDQITLQEQIARYAAKIQYQTNDPNLRFITDAPAVKNGSDADVSLFVRSGKTLAGLSDNGIDVTGKMKINQSWGTLQFKSVQQDVTLTGTTEDIADFVTITGKVTLPSGNKAPYADVYVRGEKAYTSYYASADMDGQFEIRVAKNNNYVLTVDYTGYRTTQVALSVAEDDAGQNIVLQDYVVGGAAGSYKSNTSAWDLSDESNSDVTLNLQDRASGGPIYFSGVVSDAAVIEVTMTNRTNQLISEPYYKTNSNANGEYENDPGMGIIVRSANGSAYYMAYHSGYRIRWDNGSYGNMKLNTSCTDEAHSLRYAGNSVKMTLMRYKSYFFVYLDYDLNDSAPGRLVFAGENTRIKDADAVYGFAYDSSAILTVQYSDYSIISGQAAQDIIFEKLYSEINYDASTLEIEGLTAYNGKEYGLYNTDLTIKVKDIAQGDVYKITVEDSDYYLSQNNNSLVYTLTSYSAISMPVINIGWTKSSGYLVSGQVNAPAEITAINEQSVRTLCSTDASGNYAVYLPDRTYNIIARADGYMGDYTSVTVNGAAVENADITLQRELLGSKAVLGATVINSRTTAYRLEYNEQELRHSVRADNNGNGGAIYFSDAASENIAIQFSFVKNGGTETNPGIGIWATTCNDPALNGPSSLRMLFKTTKAELLWRKTGAANPIRGVDRGWAPTDRVDEYDECTIWNTTCNVTRNDIVYNAVFVRCDNVYYLFIKQDGDQAYQLTARYKTNIISGAAVYGFAITAGGSVTLDVEFFDYSYVTEKSAVSTVLNDCLDGIETEQPTRLDMYLIAGQSNAAGYSARGDLSGSFANVKYAGEVNRTLSGGTAFSNIGTTYGDFIQAVTAGLGRSTSHIGPEYGMAQTLNTLYATEGGPKAFIFKSAAGGTSLLDTKTGESATYGNWYPRSMWATGFTPAASNGPTGLQYLNFVENFRKVYNTLVAAGYTPVVKGMVWMQGESDLSSNAGQVAAYKAALKAFIADIRTDLVDITGDQTLADMPFVIGKIATTFGSYNNASVPAFNTMQAEVAQEVSNVYTVETSDLIIVGENGTLGTDQYHFNAADMVTLGTRFAQAILNANAPDSSGDLEAA